MWTRRRPPTSRSAGPWEGYRPAAPLCTTRWPSFRPTTSGTSSWERIEETREIPTLARRARRASPAPPRQTRTSTRARPAASPSRPSPASAATMTATLSAGATTAGMNVTLVGSGSVASNPAGITCGADCTEAFACGTGVTLTATPGGGSTFSAWSGGGCSGAGTCSVTMDQPRAVTATFTTGTLHTDGGEGGHGDRNRDEQPGGDQLRRGLLRSLRRWHERDADGGSGRQFDICGLVGWRLHGHGDVRRADDSGDNSDGDVHAEDLRADGGQVGDRHGHRDEQPDGDHAAERTARRPTTTAPA